MNFQRRLDGCNTGIPGHKFSNRKSGWRLGQFESCSLFLGVDMNNFALGHLEIDVAK